MNVQQLPLVNACLNGLATCLIFAGLFFIRKGDREAHKCCMLGALGVSSTFLACYLVYHFNVVSVTRFTHGGWPRSVYFFILFTHIPLAVLTLPMLWLTVIPALKGHDPLHRKWAKRTVPIWLYVSVTGVLVYLMLYVWFPPSLG